MAKNFKIGIGDTLSPTKKGIDNIYSPTSPLNPPKGDVEAGEVVEIGEAGAVVPGTSSGVVELPKAATENVLVGYHIRYPKELQKRIKRFCIEHDGIDMKDVFTQGAMMYLDKYQ
jgi:predicted RecA/RadA family phage recombinase